jgi:hypothetical protein
MNPNRPLQMQRQRRNANAKATEPARRGRYKVRGAQFELAATRK